MFLIKYFKYGLMLPKLLTRQKESIIKVFIYFIVLTFIMNFPLTWLAFENNGTKLNFIQENLTSENPEWTNLPNGTLHRLTGFTSDITETEYFFHKEYIYVFTQDGNYNVETGKHHIVFNKSYITYIDNTGHQISTTGYDGFTTSFNLNELNFASPDDLKTLYNTLANGVEKSFANYIILYATLRNQFVQIIASIIYAFILACIIQLFRFGFQRFLSFKEGLNFVMMASTLPAILALVFGLILPGFAPVVFNLSLGITVMLVMLAFARKTLV